MPRDGLAKRGVEPCGKGGAGGGRAPAQAEDFGRAALRHLVAHRPSADLVAALAALPGGPILALPLAMMRLLADPGRDAILPDPFPEPLLRSYVEAQPFAIALHPAATGLRAVWDCETPAAPPEASRIDLPESLRALLQTYADRLLVPESDRSRLGGAGAGLSDND
ncbi:hypothetical protein BOO69_13140 [Sulfitobacter alexandrii]|uniref:Uncharacterized protein n=1 Tax=Sulfitobacter alexandrii TaxID=1917485 RepID=A0A1J0WIV9_9RHOB|nr:hypothetical protein BOO69_13140 [Sulfitobacter alexandrii]